MFLSVPVVKIYINAKCKLSCGFFITIKSEIEGEWQLRYVFVWNFVGIKSFCKWNPFEFFHSVKGKPHKWKSIQKYDRKYD